jgi:formylglycine-generating enzyme required for sulfatase activity
MIRIPSGSFGMGSADFYPDEGPVRRVRVEGFWIDEAPVTVSAYRRFVADTDHITEAEKPPDPAAFPDADPELLVPGSLVFRPTSGPVPLDDWRRWWHWTPGAQWRHPEGPGSIVGGREHHPVTHVSRADALAYAEWAGKTLPTEAEWEYAARGGLEGAIFPWGDDFAPRGRPMANTWQGEFPWRRDTPRWSRTSPVRFYPPNGYGLYDVAGNVWEWTADRYTAPLVTNGESEAPPACCVPIDAGPARFVVKGGSHLCAPTYCLRYRPAARQGQDPDTSTGHIGFRCVLR